MRKICIGKNSTIVSLLDKSIFDCILSYRELKENSDWSDATVFVFSWSKKLSENLELADKIFSNNPAGVIFISSLSVELENYTQWAYPKNKKLLEHYYRCNHSNVTVLRLGLVEKTHNFGRYIGMLPIARLSEIERWIRRGSVQAPFQHSYVYNKPNFLQSRFCHIYFPLSMRYPRSCRLLDALLKISGIRTYGYTLWLTTKDSKPNY